MSENEESPIEDFDPESTESERLEYGRQLAMDGILANTLGPQAAAEPPRRNWMPVVGLAAVVLVAAGLGVAMLENGWATRHAAQVTMDTARPEEERALQASELTVGASDGYGIADPRAPAQKPMPNATGTASPPEISEALRVGKDRAHTPVPGAPMRTRFGEARYDRTEDNPFRASKADALSTFSIDVDTASYTNIRDLLTRQQRPPRDSVRIEEMINYFDYDYPQPTGEHPIGVQVDMSQAPWAPRHRLVRIGLQARHAHDDRPPANLVFLIDVSGSMRPANKLPLLKKCLVDLVHSLRPNDRIALAVYSGAAGLTLDSTPVAEKQTILDALDRLEAGGSTNGGAGIQLAYKTAQAHFLENGINRVILATDGDFNVGIADRRSLIGMIEQKRQTGVFLSVLGFGRGNLRDSQMEQIANKGNGAYYYIDSVREGHRVLVDKLDASLMTIAKDVKVQVEFNPKRVASYRLIGYANRLLAARDFNDDTKDAGEMGAGHAVTALYEIVPVGTNPGVDKLRYNKPPAATEPGTEFGDELMFVKVRYKDPTGQRSKRLTLPCKDDPRTFDTAPDSFRFAAAVAAFGMLLRDSEHKGTTTFRQVLALAESAIGEDEAGYRSEFLELVTAARGIFGDRR